MLRSVLSYGLVGLFVYWFGAGLFAQVWYGRLEGKWFPLEGYKGPMPNWVMCALPKALPSSAALRFCFEDKDLERYLGSEEWQQLALSRFLPKSVQRHPIFKSGLAAKQWLLVLPLAWGERFSPSLAKHIEQLFYKLPLAEEPDYLCLNLCETSATWRGRLCLGFEKPEQHPVRVLRRRDNLRQQDSILVYIQADSSLFLYLEAQKKQHLEFMAYAEREILRLQRLETQRLRQLKSLKTIHTKTFAQMMAFEIEAYNRAQDSAALESLKDLREVWLNLRKGIEEGEKASQDLRWYDDWSMLLAQLSLERQAIQAMRKEISEGEASLVSIELRLAQRLQVLAWLRKNF